MVEWSNELLENMKRFRDETGITYEQMKKAGNDTQTYSDEFIEFLATENLTPEENREELLKETMELLTSDESIKAVKILQDRIGFTPAQLTEMLDETQHEAENLLTDLATEHHLKYIEILVKIGGVDPQVIADKIASGADGEDKGEIAVGETFPNMNSDLFPQADWEKIYDDGLFEGKVDNPELVAGLGEPKQGFAGKVRNSQSGDKFR